MFNVKKEPQDTHVIKIEPESCLDDNALDTSLQGEELFDIKMEDEDKIKANPAISSLLEGDKKYWLQSEELYSKPENNEPSSSMTYPYSSGYNFNIGNSAYMNLAQGISDDVSSRLQNHISRRKHYRVPTSRPGTRPRIGHYNKQDTNDNTHPYTETQLKPDIFLAGDRTTYGCRICGQTFACQTSFVRHKRIHIGKPLHTCETCGKHFYRKDHFSGHKCRYRHQLRKQAEIKEEERLEEERRELAMGGTSTEVKE